MKRDSEYQDKSIQDWATYLKYLQSILIEFGLDYASKKRYNDLILLEMLSAFNVS